MRSIARRFGAKAPLTPAFVTAEELTPRAHLEMQAALQRHVDSSISKTINCPADISFEAFKDIYLEAYDLGLKGCTTYRPNAVTGAVLSRSAGSQARAGPAASRPSRHAEAADAELAETPLLPGLVLPDRAGRGRLHGQAARARGRARRLHLQAQMARLRSRHVHHHQRHRGDGPAGGGHRQARPFEIFINSKNLEHYAWTVALTRMISAIFRRGGDVAFVVEELKAVFDPQGGQWMGGRYVPSLLAAIGGVIETHMIRTGFLAPPRQPGEEEAGAAGQGLGRRRAFRRVRATERPRQDLPALQRTVAALAGGLPGVRQLRIFQVQLTLACPRRAEHCSAACSGPATASLLAECLEITHVPSHFGSKSLLPSLT